VCWGAMGAGTKARLLGHTPPHQNKGIETFAGKDEKSRFQSVHVSRRHVVRPELIVANATRVRKAKVSHSKN
jgi:hypothetical protein